MQPWRKKKGLMRQVRFQCVLEPLEREILGNMSSTVAEALIARAQSSPKDELAEMTGLSSGHKEAPEDPALARLLPDFERDGDEEFEGDNSLLRSFHENDIIRAKLSNLQVVNTALGPDGGVEINLSEEEAHAWVAAINDMRLYLLTEGQVDTSPLDIDTIAEWLAYNQDSLLDVLLG
ncbi:DUF2017 family protein [Corynebacterium sp. 3HC-13]|uniref:DUF2017 domain-containing protein n=1 Tax=Corynebacterium poyangense TaxID=2684405 RepID=UPI001CCC6EBB|nr:DUF2017 domain-containing protein [Corynebacterium poyangense]MBZ8178223.1 DUF2017 family protein [Corynebacterium poyangense]